MTSDWVEKTIGEVAEIVGGGTPSTKDLSNFNGDVPWLTPKDLSGVHPRYVSSGERSLSRKGLQSCSARMLPAGTVLLTTRAPIGYVAIAASEISTNQGFRSLVPRAELDHEFLYYWLKANVPELERHASGSTFKELSGSALSRIKIGFPRSLPKQQSIAAVLSALDDKIELNRRMSETLEELVREVHRGWFVDQNGRPSVNSLDRPPLPSWSPGQLRDLASEKRQGVDPDTVAPDTPYIGLEHMPRRRTTLDAWGYAEGLGSNKHQFGRGDILFGKLRPYFHKVGVAPVNGICSTDIVVVTPKDETYFGFLLGVLSSDKFVQFTDSASTGTRMPRTSWKTMSTYEVRVPPPQVARVFNDLVQPIVARTINATLESKALSELRDTLLPKLISGEIRVPEGEQLVGEAV